MNHKEQCDMGRIERYCDEGRIEIDVNEKGKVVAMKGYTKARNLRMGWYSIRGISKMDRLNNLKTGVLETLKMNGATKDEIIQVCNKILKELGIEE